jgi:hypothetical protein
MQIPREIIERNRRGPPPFLEVAVLEAEPVYRGPEGERSVDIKLTSFLPSLAEVPAKELEALKERVVRSGFDFIDFWLWISSGARTSPSITIGRTTAPARIARSKP